MRWFLLALWFVNGQPHTEWRPFADLASCEERADRAHALAGGFMQCVHIDRVERQQTTQWAPE